MPETTPTHISNRAELAKVLGHSPTSLTRWSRLKGAPRKLKAGYSVEAWRKFIQANKLAETPHRPANNPDAKSREAAAKAQFWELRVLEKQERTFDRDEVDQHYQESIAKALQFLRSKFVQELPPVLVGLTANEIADLHEDALHELQTMMSRKR